MLKTRIAERIRNMIDIVCEGGTTLYGIQMTFQLMKHLVLDGVIPDSGFLELEFDDGSRGMIRKGRVIGFYETEPNAQD